MKYLIEIKRRRSEKDEPYFQTFEYETELESATAAAALAELNRRKPLRDINGAECERIVWECSCMQKKCGACAMVINGRPQLACAAVLNEQKGSKIKIEPLSKFPVIADLYVDRSIMFEALRQIGAWLDEEKRAGDKNNELLYEASRCLQCGCCLEVCPNFYSGGNFSGMAALVPVSRLLEELDGKQSRSLRKQYGKHIYNGCGKSLACRNICPAGIDIEKLMVNSNSVMLWKHLFKK